MSIIGVNAVLVYLEMLKRAEKDIQKALQKEVKSLGEAIAKSVTQGALDTGVEPFLKKQTMKRLPKVSKVVLGVAASQLKKLYSAKKLPPDLDPTNFRVLSPIYQPKPLSSGKLHVNFSIPLKKLLGPKGEKVELRLWLGVDGPKLKKQEWNIFSGAGVWF